MGLIWGTASYYFGTCTSLALNLSLCLVRISTALINTMTKGNSWKIWGWGLPQLATLRSYSATEGGLSRNLDAGKRRPCKKAAFWLERSACFIVDPNPPAQAGVGPHPGIGTCLPDKLFFFFFPFF